MNSLANSKLSPLDTLLGEAVNGIGIPPRPRVLEHLRVELQRADPDLERLASIIATDVSLSAGVMKMANSPYFGLGGRARTAQHAVLLLGLDTATRAITGMVLLAKLPRAVSLERFWDGSARIAQLSGWLASRIPLNPPLNPGDAYSFGLFRDCGIAVMMRRFPNYAETLGIANHSAELSFTAIEDSRHCGNHAAIGYLMARNWWLPDGSCLAIRHHHDVSAIVSGEIPLPPASAQLIAVAQLAERIVQTTAGLSQTREWDKLGTYCLRILGIDDFAVDMLSVAAASLMPQGA